MLLQLLATLALIVAQASAQAPAQHQPTALVPPGPGDTPIVIDPHHTPVTYTLGADTAAYFTTTIVSTITGKIQDTQITSVPLPAETAPFVWTVTQSTDDWFAADRKADKLFNAFLASIATSLGLAGFVGLPLILWYRRRVRREMERGDAEGDEAPPAYSPPRGSLYSVPSSRKVLGIAGAMALPKASAAPLRRALVATTMTLYTESRDQLGLYSAEATGVLTTTLRIPDKTQTVYPYTTQASYVHAMHRQKVYSALIGVSWAVPMLVVAGFMLVRARLDRADGSTRSSSSGAGGSGSARRTMCHLVCSAPRRARRRTWTRSRGGGAKCHRWTMVLRCVVALWIGARARMHRDAHTHTHKRGSPDPPDLGLEARDHSNLCALTAHSGQLTLRGACSHLRPSQMTATARSELESGSNPCPFDHGRYRRRTRNERSLTATIPRCTFECWSVGLGLPVVRTARAVAATIVADHDSPTAPHRTHTPLAQSNCNPTLQNSVHHSTNVHLAYYF